MPENLDKYKDTFLSEAKEHVASMNTTLLKLEKEPAKVSLVNDLFRDAHTLKSMAATMKYNKTAQLCHVMEDVLDEIKKKKVKLERCADILFECFDTLELSLKMIAKGEEELDTDALIQKLQYLLSKRDTNNEPQIASHAPRDTQIEKIQSIEVKVDKLDLLMNLTEELLIHKMKLNKIKETLQNPELNAAVDALGRIITDLQYNVMQSRMVSIGFVFNRFYRMVRDLSKKQKKEINLETEGSDIELDRTVIDEIGESLVHLLRNSVDHGIETPQERRRLGKPSQGTIRLIAQRIRNFVVIEITDDGAGLDIGEIKNIAIKRGILSPQASKEEITNTIFSGVSTTKQVTATSGRGFGLNIVKNKIESLGGSIKVESVLKKGTTFTIEIPLTLAIIKALFFDVGGKTYAVPLASVERLIKVRKEDIKGMMGNEAVVLDEENIPITRLDVLFGAPYLALENRPIVIVQKGHKKLGLSVDGFLATQEIVIKPLDPLMKNKYCSGCTIVGSGEVVLILDVANLTLSNKLDTR